MESIPHSFGQEIQIISAHINNIFTSGTLHPTL